MIATVSLPLPFLFTAAVSRELEDTQGSSGVVGALLIVCTMWAFLVAATWYQPIRRFVHRRCPRAAALNESSRLRQADSRRPSRRRDPAGGSRLAISTPWSTVTVGVIRPLCKDSTNVVSCASSVARRWAGGSTWTSWWARPR